MGINQDILVRIAPGVDAHTHKHTTTGTLDSKFGFPLSTGQAEAAVNQSLSSSKVNLAWEYHSPYRIPPISIIYWEYQCKSSFPLSKIRRLTLINVCIGIAQIQMPLLRLPGHRLRLTSRLPLSTSLDSGLLVYLSSNASPSVSGEMCTVPMQVSMKMATEPKVAGSDVSWRSLKIA